LRKILVAHANDDTIHKLKQLFVEKQQVLLEAPLLELMRALNAVCCSKNVIAMFDEQVCARLRFLLQDEQKVDQMKATLRLVHCFLSSSRDARRVLAAFPELVSTIERVMPTTELSSVSCRLFTELAYFNSECILANEQLCTRLVQLSKDYSPVCF